MQPSEVLTQHVRQFLRELDALCARYGVCLETYPGEELLVRSRTPDDTSSIAGCHVVDDTEESPPVDLRAGAGET